MAQYRFHNTLPHSVRLEGAVKCSVETARGRLLFVLVMFCLSFAALAFRLVSLSVDDNDTTSHYIATDAVPFTERADIVDRNGVLLATNLKVNSLYADARIIMDPVEAATQLHRIFPDLSYDSLLKKLSSDKAFIWIKRFLHPNEQKQVNDLGLPGLHFREEEKRVYPHGSLLAHVLGVVGENGHGLAGIEKTFNDTLQSLALEENHPLQLSIDMRVQDILRRELTTVYERHNAKSAAGVVMDVNSGEILAISSLPGFNPNMPTDINASHMFNHATLGLYEMGSTFKTFTMALALEKRVTSMKGMYDATDPIKVGRFTISDHHAKKRWLSVPEVYMYSSNIGTAKIADEIGATAQQDFLKKLGLLDTLELEIPETATPLYPDRWGRISTMTVGYGHGIAVTPVHVASATASLINGGEFHPPTLLKDQHKEPHRVISTRTSEWMRQLLRLVVSEGTGGRAEVDGYFVGGKTGTAEKPGVGRYDRKRMVTSFVGAFPMDNPRYVVLAVMDEPQGIKETYGYATAGFTAAPVVKNVIKHIAPLLGVEPINKEDPHIKDRFDIEYEIKGQKVASF